MNINDPSIQEADTPDDRLVAMFSKQRLLIDKYHTIETGNGSPNVRPEEMDLHSPVHQRILKDHAWRVAEELAEASEAYVLESHMSHFCEEVADALHFLIELTIFSGMGPTDLIDANPPTDLLSCLYLQAERLNRATTHADYFNPIYMNLGRTMNCLKNKPWKTSHMLTDIMRYRQCLRDTWQAFICAAQEHEITAQKLYSLYFKKNQVNQFRIRSDY